MIAIGSDHAGLPLKEEVLAHLKEKGVAFEDFGTFTADSCDYPEFAVKVSRAVVCGKCERGILICGTGIGISIAANKVRGVRAALCENCFCAKYTRMHNDANIMAMGSRVVGPGLACMIVDAFLETPFEGGRHQRRVDMIAQIEEEEAGGAKA